MWPERCSGSGAPEAADQRHTTAPLGALTKAISHRGTAVSGLGETLDQHFAIVLDNKLMTVPLIDYKMYPDGIDGSNGADIAGNFTPRSAKDLAILLRYGPLPVNLTTAG